MKIGIVTLWNTTQNYGAVLQCYALQEFLRRKGHEPYLIRYSYHASQYRKKHLNIIRIINGVKNKIYQFRLQRVQEESKRFDQFIQINMKSTKDEYSTWQQLKDNPPEADLYIAGSDQVWNFYNTPVEDCRDNIHVYFLDFGENVHKASYAASWMKKYVRDEHLREIIPLLNQFEYVSVREQEGIELCEKCGIESAEWVCDPTLLLKKEDYRKLYKNTTNQILPNRKYVLLYMVLTRNNTFNIDSVYEFARQNNLEVVYVTGDKSLDHYPKKYPTIEEWIYLVDHAEYVITNSFHGTVFSLLFQKQFATISLDGYAESTNARINALFKMFHVEERFLRNYDFTVLKKKYSSTLEVLPNNFSNFLESL